VSIPSPAIYELDSFKLTLTNKIQQDLPTWYGPSAELLGSPTFQSRPWSYFFRYVVRVSGVSTKALLVKIRHTETMSIIEAMGHEKMKAEMQDEYDSLVKIRKTFANLPDEFFAIRPLAYYADLNVLVMEEADIRPVKSYFQARAMWWEGQARVSFEGILARVGRWLRIFHD
jgi:hypothetical protein